MRINSFIAEYIDGSWREGRMQGNRVFMLKHHHSFPQSGKESVGELTSLGGFEADNKRLSGESINISWSIIWVLILASDFHRVSPEHIQTKKLVPAMFVLVEKWHNGGRTSAHL